MKLRPLNHTIHRCPACGSQLMRFLDGRGYAVAFVAWLAFMLWITRDMTAGWAFLLCLVIVPFWSEAEDRLYHAWWHWRHPERCQGDHGHHAPQPT